MVDNEFVSVHVLDNRFEADLLVESLKREGIPVILKPYEETAYDSLFISQKGWGAILVPSSKARKASEIIREILEDLRAKKLFEDPSEVDPLLWERLNEAVPDEVCKNAQVRFDPKERAYLVPFLAGLCRVIPGERRVELVGNIPFNKLDFELVLVILHYLMDSRLVPLAGRWIGEKDLPGGDLFFTGPHQLPTRELIGAFGRDTSLFRAAMEKLGGVEMKFGDASYRLWALPRVPVMFILWEGDEEFEPAIHIRFDASVTEHFPVLDTIWALINVICRNILAASGKLRVT